MSTLPTCPSFFSFELLSGAPTRQREEALSEKFTEITDDAAAAHTSMFVIHSNGAVGGVTYVGVQLGIRGYVRTWCDEELLLATEMWLKRQKETYSQYKCSQ